MHIGGRLARSAFKARRMCVYCWNSKLIFAPDKDSAAPYAVSWINRVARERNAPVGRFAAGLYIYEDYYCVCSDRTWALRVALRKRCQATVDRVYIHSGERWTVWRPQSAHAWVGWIRHRTFKCYPSWSDARRQIAFPASVDVGGDGCRCDWQTMDTPRRHAIGRTGRG